VVTRDSIVVMPRQPRLLIDGYPLHIVQRGHNRQACFLGARDYSRYLTWLSEAAAELDCRLHAYVLMTNHVHLLMTPRDAAAVPRLIMSVGRRYVQYFNRGYGRTGTLWDSRYKSSTVESDLYLLACYRYIELNPVRAGVVDDPADYPWSSYRANALGQSDSRLSPHACFAGLGHDAYGRHEAYRRLFESPVEETLIEDIRRSLHFCLPLGTRRFAERLEQATGLRCEARPRGRPRRDGVTSQPRLPCL
jgi:putative transposase